NLEALGSAYEPAHDVSVGIRGQHQAWSRRVAAIRRYPVRQARAADRDEAKEIGHRPTDGNWGGVSQIRGQFTAVGQRDHDVVREDIGRSVLCAPKTTYVQRVTCIGVRM